MSSFFKLAMLNQISCIFKCYSFIVIEIQGRAYVRKVLPTLAVSKRDVIKR